MTVSLATSNDIKVSCTYDALHKKQTAALKVGQAINTIGKCSVYDNVWNSRAAHSLREALKRAKGHPAPRTTGEDRSGGR